MTHSPTDEQPKRGPGRPRKDAREDRAETHQRRRKKRGARVSGFRLGVAMDKLDFDRFSYRFFNDTPGGARLYTAINHDEWEMVSQDGGAVKEDATDGAISIVVGTAADGSALRAYLCRKPKEWFEEDKAEKEEELERQIAELRRGHTAAGSAQADYVPTSGISMR